MNQVRHTVAAALAAAGTAAGPLERVCRVCLDMLPVDGVSISVSDGARHREMLVATDAVSASLEEAQFTLGEGPCFEAFESQRPVLVPDLADTTVSWPSFAAQIAELPVAAIFAFPIQQGAVSFGALDMYRRTPGWFTAAELTAALLLVDAAAAALSRLRTIGTEMEGSVHNAPGDQWLADLPTGRIEIHQATGVLLAQLGVSAAVALTRLRAHAFTTGRPIDAVARDILDGSLRLDEQPN